MLWESIIEESADIAMDYQRTGVFTRPHTNENVHVFSVHINVVVSDALLALLQSLPVVDFQIPRPGSMRRLNMDSSMQDMVIDELSFYDDETTTRDRVFNASPPLMSLLSPEGSPQRCSPIQPKRHRNAEKENLDGSFTGGAGNAPASPAPIPSLISAYKPTVPLAATNILRRCISMNDAEIMSALARFDNKDEPDLIGDFSRPFVLPLVEGRHPDLKSISCSTVARLLKGEYDDKITSYKIIDCRYPYEFDGGHIRGARNLFTQEQIIGEFLTQKKTKKEHAEASKRHIIIFHCEFSSERGPKLSRFLRNHDRARNTSSYPALDYPEVYLLHNGYKEFFENYADLCEPHAYRPMLEPSYYDEYRHFRSKSKSWNSDGANGTTKRTKKFRSRLMLNLCIV
uniref:protein-tyrosine-phosphatase n=1 Tax=Glossina austeni TaxID=7395 RepID=A0A1A9VYE4_GLOAU